MDLKRSHNFSRAVALIRAGRFGYLSRLSRQAFRIRFNRHYRAPLLHVLILEVTRKCNLACVTCPHSSLGEAEKSSMSFDLFERILGQLDVPALNLVVFSGLGEPMIHPELFRMTRSIKQQGNPIIRVNTNGTHLHSEELAGLLEDSGVDELRVSIGAASDPAYRGLKGVSRFAEVEANIHNFLKGRGSSPFPFLTLQILRLPATKNEIAPFVARWKPHLGPGDRVLISDSHSFAEQVRGLHAGRIPGSLRIPCRQLWALQYVAHDGSILPCCMDVLKTMPLGNVRETSLSECWNSAELQELRRLHLERRWDRIDLCRRCTTWWYLGSPPH